MHWLTLIGASLGIAFTIWRILFNPEPFISLGKIHVEMLTSANEEAFCAAQLQILQSRELGKRALHRIAEKYPDLKPVPVEIRAVYTRGSPIINIAALGPEPQFTPQDHLRQSLVPIG